MNEPTGLWVYCVIENKGPLNWEAQGISGTSPVYTVAHGDFAMVVSEEPMKRYRMERDFLIAHQLVNEKVMQAQPVLPVRFCTMAEGAGQIIEQVLKQKGRVEEFRKTISEIRGKSEYGLRARWKNLDQVFADLSRENEKVKAAKEKALKLSGLERHAKLIEIGHVVKEALEEKSADTAKALMRELIPYAAQSKKNKVLGDMNVLNAAFLVDEKKQVEFDQALNALVGRYESQIQFKYIGPTPPFNFVEIVIHWDEANKTLADKKEKVGTGTGD
jgi:hypothetical protein